MRASVGPFARIWVNSGIFHLDGSYEYGVPAEFEDQVGIGVRVQVDFNGREVEAIVLERLDSTSVVGNVKDISKVLSRHKVATATSLALIEKAADYWACSPWDILRSAIPPRVAGVDKAFIPEPGDVSKSQETNQADHFIALGPVTPPQIQIIKVIKESIEFGSTLILAPDESDIDAICLELERNGLSFLRIDSSISRAERYLNYLKAINYQKTIVIGARSAVFAPIHNLKTVIIYKESSHEHYEIRSPGWNVREVVELRKSLEQVRVKFLGYVPSLELASLIQERRLKYFSQSHRLRVRAFSSLDGTLLPGGIFPEIRKALLEGPILFLVPRKGYGNALLCAECRNVAVCICGSRLAVLGKGGDPSCTLCFRSYPEWSCRWCRSQRQYLAARGIERAGEEISRAFPGVPLIFSFGGVIKKSVEDRPALILATPGAAPTVEGEQGGFSAVIILEGLRFFSHPDLRAQERARELFFETAAMARVGAPVILSIPQENPIVASLTRWNPGVAIRKELNELQEIPMPPYVTSVVITGPGAQLSTIADGLTKAIQAGRIPASVNIFAPMDLGKGEAKLVIYCSHQERVELVTFIHELQRRRSMAKKEFLAVRINPYSL